MMLYKPWFLFGNAAGHIIVKTLLSSRPDHPRPVKSAQLQADIIADILLKQGCSPDRLAVDGIPGSGKSTLAHALAAKLGMKWKSLDHQNFGLPGSLEYQNTIYEHHRLLRTMDVDAFDAIIYNDEPVEFSLAKLTRRRRGLVMLALLDFDRMKKVGKIAFEVCDGEPIAIPESYLLLKLRPSGGFRARENIKEKLRSSGLNVSGLKKEEMLFLLAYGKRRHGLKAYLVDQAFFSLLGFLTSQLHSKGRRLISGGIMKS